MREGSPWTKAGAPGRVKTIFAMKRRGAARNAQGTPRRKISPKLTGPGILIAGDGYPRFDHFDPRIRTHPDPLPKKCLATRSGRAFSKMTLGAHETHEPLLKHTLSPPQKSPARNSIGGASRPFPVML
jgi:hypothetical protein